jgi:predicted transcriptional regulator
MTENQTISWIFLATAIASQAEPADFNSISNIADGINHALPTHKELQTTLTWLTSKDFVTKNGGKYSLTEKGNFTYDLASRQTQTQFEIWDNLETALKEYRT